MGADPKACYQIAGANVMVKCALGLAGEMIKIRKFSNAQDQLKHAYKSSILLRQRVPGDLKESVTELVDLMGDLFRSPRKTLSKAGGAIRTGLRLWDRLQLPIAAQCDAVEN